MKKLILLSVLVLGIAISLSAQDIPFIFDKNRIDVGTMYVYEYSANKEDFEPGSSDYFYVKTLNDIEIIQIFIKDTTAVFFIKYKMNWDYMMLEKLEAHFLKSKDELAIGATLKSTYAADFSSSKIYCTNTNRVKDGFKEFNHTFKLKDIPTYYYQLTDLKPLWFALRFYPLEKEKVTVNYFLRGFTTIFDIKYIGKEEVEAPYGKVSCHKFELFPEMSFAMKMISKPEKAWIWLTSEDETRYMVKYKNNNVRSTFTRNMEYRLAEKKKMTLEEWEKFKERCGVKVEATE